MRVLHICLSNFYIDGQSYQENQLVRQHVDDGHEVLVLASTETRNRNQENVYTDPGEYVGIDGARVIRLPHAGWAPSKVMRKLRYYPEVYDRIADFRPDAMLFHATCAGALSETARYAADHPDVVFHIDSHEDWNNSARNFISRELLHKRFYGPILRRALSSAGKILCVNIDAMDFVKEVYRVPREKLEFFPLGGNILSEADHVERRAHKRRDLGIEPHHIALVQSGKQTARKKLVETLSALRETPQPDLRLFIAGVLMNDIREEAEALIAADDRVMFLGWQDADQLTDLLCAADLYVQPGTQSATMQHSLCCHCAVAIDDVRSHRPYIDGNGWLISEDMPLAHIFAALNGDNLAAKGTHSHALATRMLDYAALGERVLRP